MATSNSTKNSTSGPGTPRENCLEGRQPIATAAGELVKCKENGDPDWETLGKILTASVLGEVLCISYADFKYGRMTRGASVDIDWKFAYEEKGVIVLKRVTDAEDRGNSQNVICFAGRGVLNFPVEQVASVVKNADNFKLWNKFLVESRVLEVLSETEKSKQTLVYFVHENNQCLVRAKRDFFVYDNYVYRDDGKFVHSGLSIEHPVCPPVKGIIRAKVCMGSGWALEPYEGNPSKTLATYIANVDLCAPLPASMASHLLQTQPLTIYYLKKFLKSVNKITRGLSSQNNSRVSRTESDLETSLTSTMPSDYSILPVDHQRSSLYVEPMGVDHFMGVQKRSSKKQDRSKEDHGYSSARSMSTDSQGRSQSSSALSEDLY